MEGMHSPSVYVSFKLPTTATGYVTTFVRHNSLERKLKASGKSLNKPYGIVMNQKSNVFFVANCGNHTILKITSSGMETYHSLYDLIVLTHYQGAVRVYAGSGHKGSDDGVGTISRFNRPTWLAIDQETGDLFVSDTLNHRIRKITPEGELHLFSSSTLLAKL